METPASKRIVLDRSVTTAPLGTVVFGPTVIALWDLKTCVPLSVWLARTRSAGQPAVLVNVQVIVSPASTSMVATFVPAAAISGGSSQEENKQGTCRSVGIPVQFN